MEVKVKLSNLRTAPRKVRQVVDLVRGKRATDAQSILLFTVNKSARPVLKLLNSALAAAKQNLKLEEASLFISKITVDEGPKLKRWHPMSRGRAFPIIKRTSHVVLTLEEINPINTDIKKQTKTEKIKNKKIQKVEKKEVKTLGRSQKSTSTGEAKRKINKKV